MTQNKAFGAASHLIGSSFSIKTAAAEFPENRSPQSFIPEACCLEILTHSLFRPTEVPIISK
ncbi:MAG TPA: hypothetical protein DCM19_05600 [Parasutterella excrementihominis]|jgi:hypothetical protein|uniref:hypothetical protein n=1 Tax=Parasutterella TaxID=577310 RepID=UPI000EB98652|nr:MULTISPECIES: hypothetical protein [Parasutterella]MBS5224830.1 hypothetical protein [Parasutterella sp.]HAI61315.1 hypothetical protein [Parasutterella excrementihominis]HBZ28603.1 hypothetical protein [Parasutterella excrementihominis]